MITCGVELTLNLLFCLFGIFQSAPPVRVSRLLLFYLLFFQVKEKIGIFFSYFFVVYENFPDIVLYSVCVKFKSFWSRCDLVDPMANHEPAIQAVDGSSFHLISKDPNTRLDCFHFLLFCSKTGSASMLNWWWCNLAMFTDQKMFSFYSVFVYLFCFEMIYHIHFLSHLFLGTRCAAESQRVSGLNCHSSWKFVWFRASTWSASGANGSKATLGATNASVKKFSAWRPFKRPLKSAATNKTRILNDQQQRFECHCQILFFCRFNFRQKLEIADTF